MTEGYAYQVTLPEAMQKKRTRKLIVPELVAAGQAELPKEQTRLN